VNAAEFLAMGGFGLYVSASYIVAALAIVTEIVAVRTRLGATRRTQTEEEVRR
jgi:heme exporter protein CcmD